VSDEGMPTRMARPGGWVEVVMQTLATLGLEAILIELDEVRGVNLEEEYFGEGQRTPMPKGL
jgi:hypothetical protein